jgi:eukaryotic-like serine/threonine-protein kinase
MGEVYKATDTRLGRTVAIKTLKSEHRGRLDREARAIAALNHPNICQLYDVGPNYLVMEFIDGTPLRGPLPLHQALQYAVQICDALGAAHKKNITHRDLKPSNILVTASGVKLLDFGLAKVELGNMGTSNGRPNPDGTTRSVDLTEAGTILGTTAYMAPEQAKGQEADTRSDVFSFGLVLYEMLSGRQAFSRGSAMETMVAIVHDDPAFLEVQRKLSAIITRCLHTQPRDRYQTMDEVRTALEHAALEEKTKSPAAGTSSIAVLPFANIGADKENEYFSDGLAEEILNLLAKIPGLKVIARTSSFAFRGRELDIRKIAKTLGVNNVLEGSVRRAGGRLRVIAQLIHAADGTHLWSERYDRDMTDVFAIQDEIGQAISEALQLRLAPRAHPVNIEAYQHYLKGQYYRVRYTPESLVKAKECFEQALAIDPNYSLAYNGLAAYYYVLPGVDIKSARDVLPLAKSAAEKALAIDPAQSEARSVLAAAAASFDYDWKTADTHFRRAMAAEPVPPLVRHRFALYYLVPRGRIPDAVEQSRLALETDPLSMVLHFGVATSMYLAKQYRESIEQARRALEIDSNSYLLWGVMGVAQLGSGATQEAIASLERAAELAPWYKIGIGSLAAAYHLAGDRESKERAAKLAGQLGQTFGAALYYAASGEVDAMFGVLDLAYQRRDRSLLIIPTLPLLDPYRADLRFQTLLQQMNLA